MTNTARECGASAYETAPGWTGCPTSRGRASSPYVLGLHDAAGRCSSSRATTGSPGSRTRRVRTCTGSSTARGSDAPCDGGASDVAFRPPIRRRHPEVATARAVGHSFRGSIPGLHVPLSMLRRSGLPLPTHDSGPLWVATPSTFRTFIDNTAPISPAHIGDMKGLFVQVNASPVMRRPPLNGTMMAMRNSKTAIGGLDS
jgi:hypothetical protein